MPAVVQTPLDGIEQALALPLYAHTTAEKHASLASHLRLMEQFHREQCAEYRAIIDAVWNGGRFERLEDAPFIPVRLFKEYLLKSIADDDVFKVMTSSGTSGAQVSRIYLDRTTASLQTKALAKIMKSVIGASRLPMVIVDCEGVIEDHTRFSARGAGILGFSMFGSKTFYALDADMRLRRDELMRFVAEYGGESILLFGFTSIIWDYFYRQLHEAGDSLDIGNGLLIHGGGWKKLQDRAVSPQAFKDALRGVCGIDRVFNYYGMVEQTGSISLECEQGFLHTHGLNEILIRRAENLAPATIGEPGIIQTLSILPLSYPGHSLLTEDEGVIVGEDDCACGRKGRYFQVVGRIQHAEIRGCSDTLEQLA